MTLKVGDKIESHKMVMVITEETDKAFIGYHEYKGEKGSKLVLTKETLVNPHYCKHIKLLG